MPINITFRKTGKEIKVAIQNRRQQLEVRLKDRNAALDVFIKHPGKVRSYMVRGAGGGGHGRYTLYGSDEITSEELQETMQLCRRIFEIEQELHRLSLIAMHLSDEQVFDLSFDDLIAYGFEASIDTE